MLLEQQMKDRIQPVKLPHEQVALSIPHTNMAETFSPQYMTSSHPLDSNFSPGVDPGTATIVGSFTIG